MSRLCVGWLCGMAAAMVAITAITALFALSNDVAFLLGVALGFLGSSGGMWIAEITEP